MKRATPVLLALFLFAAQASAAGLLVPRDGSPPIAIRSHRVDAVVTDGIAKTTVRQTFVNPGDAAVEAIYLFPLPDKAALTAVAMETGGQRYEGLLAERKRARAVYNEIVRQRRDPALVEQVGRNAFRLSVFPVLPKVETVIELTYTQPVPLARDTYRYVYALGLGGAASQTEQDFTLTVRMKSSAGLETVTVNDPETQVIRKGPGEFLVSFEKKGAKLERDVVVEGALAAKRPILAVETYRGKKGDGYFVAVITPPRAREDQLIPRDVILVVDTSGSMRGQKLEQAKDSALYLLDRLRPADRVNIVRFSSDVRQYSESLVPAAKEHLQKLNDFVEGFVAEGGTNIGDALKTALQGEPAPGRVRTVVFLTDGLPTVGEQDRKALIEIAKGGTETGFRVFPFGVGADVDAGLLRGFASATRGRAEIFRPGGEIESRLGAFLDRTASPVIADLALDMGVKVYDVFPRPFPDLYLGEQLVVAGRYEGGGVFEVEAKGTMGQKTVSHVVPVEFREEPGGSLAVRDLFARQKLDYLEEALRLRMGLSDDAYYAALDRGAYSTQDEIVDEIVNVSLDHQVQSAYTSFLVLLPEDRHRLDPRNLEALKEAVARAGESRKNVLGDTPVSRATPPPAPSPQKGGEPDISDAKVADHDETDNDMPFEEGLGKDDFVSDAPFEGPSTNGSIGIGGGSGGAFAGRGGRRNLVARGGGSKRTEDAVDLGLEWLAKQQKENGSWEESPAQTGLALLAFLGAGETHKHGRYRKTVREAAKYLKQIQAPDGFFGPRDADHALHGHAIATLSLCELYALTLSPLFKQCSQSGIDRLREEFEAPGSSACFWCVMAFKSASVAGLRVESGDFDNGWKSLDAARAGDFAPTTPSGVLAAQMICRIFTGEDPSKSPEIQAGMEALVKDALPSWDAASPEKADLGAIYFGTMAAFQVGGDAWRTWNEAVKGAILPRRQTDGDDRGSWDPLGNDGKLLGRVGTTALLAMCMEVYYRYRQVFGAENR